MSVYWYTLSYDEHSDEFYGIVDKVENSKNVVAFEIHNTKELIDYIKTGVMKHIDDVDGLCAFLQRQETLGKDDSLILCETTLY